MMSKSEKVILIVGVVGVFVGSLLAAYYVGETVGTTSSNLEHWAVEDGQKMDLYRAKQEVVGLSKRIEVLESKLVRAEAFMPETAVERLAREAEKAAAK